MEENFPRGGSKKRVKKDSVSVQAEEKDLFHSAEPEPKKKPKKEFGKEKNGKIVKKNDDTEKIVERTCALKKNMVSTGMLLLGCVTRVEDYALCVGLPNGLSGSIQITHISDAYTQLLQTLTETASSDNTLDVASLHEMFHVGQLLPCKVVDMSIVKKKHDFKLTINPREVNEGMEASHIKKGMVLHGCIQSLEDHGYVVDIGISGTRAFLNHADAENLNDALHVGEAVCCSVITDGDGSEVARGSLRVIKVSVDPKRVAKTQLESSVRVPLTCIVPGMKVTATVTKADEDRLLVTFLQFRGHIHSSHLPKPAVTYKSQCEIEAVILYVNGSTKIVSLSALPHLVRYSGVAIENQFGSLKRGDVLTNSTVSKVDSRVGVCFSLDNGKKAFCDIPNLRDRLVENVPDLFIINDTHKCRIMDFNPVDNLVIISLKESIMTKFLQFQDIVPGTTVECTVHQILEKGVSVKIMDHLPGFIQNIHLADFPLKYPGKKFAAGTTIKCRVLSVDVMKKRVLLTRKKSLVNSKLPILTGWSQLETDQLLDGFICNITEKGVLVAFYNYMKGWVPRRELSEEDIRFPEKVFMMGQVVKCRVLNWSEETNKLTLSFKIKLTPFGKNMVVEVPDDFKIGMLVEGKVKSVSNTGVNVTLEPTGVEAFLPRNHLSDSLEGCNLLMAHYKEGVPLKGLMYLSKASVLTVTHRKSMCDNIDQVVSEFDKLQPGMIVPGTVKRLMDYGIFIEFPGDISALVPNKYAADTFLRNTSVVFSEGQAVCAKIIQVDREKSRLLASLRLADCYDGDTDIGINLLKDTLAVMDLAQKMSKGEHGKKVLWKHHVGDICGGKVTEVTEMGLLCVLDSGCRAVITHDNMDDLDISKGGEVRGLVINLDTKEECVELCILKDVVKGFINRKGPPASKIVVRQKVNCRIVLVRKNFVVGTLKGQGAGTLAYIPVKRHLNDVLEMYQFYSGQVHPVIVKQVNKTHVLCALELHETRKLEMQGLEGEVLKNIKTPHDYKAGDLVMASVKAVFSLQINISVGQAHGRVHISEVLDTIKNGEMPLSDLQEGEEIKIKIIGFREGKSSSFLPISHPNRRTALLECSLKPSKLEKKGVDGTEDVNCTYNIGDQVQAFVQNYNNGNLNVCVSSTVQGRVNLVNLSDDPAVQENPKAHFLRGQAYNARVIGVDDSNILDLSFTDQGKIEEGRRVQGIVLCTTFSLELQLDLSQGYKGVASCTDLSDIYTDNPLRSYKRGQVVHCCILSIDEKTKQCRVSLRKSRLKDTKKTSKVKDPEVKDVQELSKKQILRGYTMGFNNSLLTVCIGNGVYGKVSREELSDYHVKSCGVVFYKGRVVTAQILSVDGDVTLTLRESRTGVTDLVPVDMRTEKEILGSDSQTEETHVKSRKRKLSVTDANNTKGENSSQESSEETVTKKSKGKKKKKSMTKLSQSREEQEEDEVKILASPPVCGVSEKPRLSVTGFSWDADLARDTSTTEVDSDDDDSDEEVQRPTKKTKAQIRAEKKEEEKRLDEFEKRQLEGDNQPVSVDEFDRLVLTSPDSSLVWLQYMAFHLQTAEIDKARAVAERALKTISFREEQEKQNVWVAFLNLENMYGSSDLLHKVLERAVAQNEPSKIYTQMINIYVKSGKIDEAEQLHNKLVRRYSQDKDIWNSFSMFYYKHGRVDDARKLLQRCLKSLNIKHHVETIAKNAQLEFKYGDAERGRTMFESVLGNYPKRTDLWSVYLDMVVKLGDCQEARQLFERVIHLKQSAKKMKFFYKKYLDFEKDYGDSETVENVRRKALEYVESQGYTED
ncbi:protein RRP5 homolog [Mizuhopecten yessoensis]|uniref:Protein RRP5-like n=1 Tax=Mizuhopecten yessoensis TaxID=6573 RepID=A0A210PGQ6_MIZYE|nr:protein RRP5 homolog [Mizuhopecten yessoensis]OWF35668.1 Protein RRP5-like [Mizuhopecten yessoensis]